MRCGDQLATIQVAGGFKSSARSDAAEYLRGWPKKSRIVRPQFLDVLSNNVNGNLLPSLSKIGDMVKKARRCGKHA
jgi:hypothetical protein